MVAQGPVLLSMRLAGPSARAADTGACLCAAYKPLDTAVAMTVSHSPKQGHSTTALCRACFRSSMSPLLTARNRPPLRMSPRSDFQLSGALM